jgi:hypothetical protein
MRTRTHSMQVTSHLLRGPHRPITTPPQWGEQLPHGTHGQLGLQTPRQPIASPTMPYKSGTSSCPIHLVPVVARPAQPYTNLSDGRLYKARLADLALKL